jgi:hypothetical protein
MKQLLTLLFLLCPMLAFGAPTTISKIPVEKLILYNSIGSSRTLDVGWFDTVTSTSGGGVVGDANTLDGFDSSDFVKIDSSQTITGNKTFTPTTGIGLKANQLTAGTSAALNVIGSTSGSVAPVIITGANSGPVVQVTGSGTGPTLKLITSGTGPQIVGTRLVIYNNDDLATSGDLRAKRISSTVSSGFYGVSGTNNNASSGIAGVYGQGTGTGNGIVGLSDSASGILGSSTSWYGITGFSSSSAGLFGESTTGPAIQAYAVNGDIFLGGDGGSGSGTGTNKIRIDNAGKIITSSTLQIRGGSPGAGKVWTGTDSAGNGQWSAGSFSGTNTGDVSLAGTPNYITIAGQVITRALIDLTAHVTGLLPIANGGTNASTASNARTNLGLAIGTNVEAWDADLDIYAGITPSANIQTFLGAANNAAAFNDISPMTTVGDVIYGGASGAATRLPGNTTTTRKFYTSTGVAGVATAPALNTLVAGDIPDISGAYQPLDSDLTALAANSTGGLWAHTAAGNGSARTITGTVNQITVTNGNGVSGDPTLSIASAYSGQTSINTVGDITVGTWEGAAIDKSFIQGSAGWDAKFGPDNNGCDSGINAQFLCDDPVTSFVLQNDIERNPMTAVGDTMYGGSSGALTRLAPNTATTIKYLTQTGTGSAGQAPAWNRLPTADDSTTGVLTGSDHTALTNLKTDAIRFTFDSDTAVIPAGKECAVFIPYACTITAARIAGDVSGSAVVDVWKSTSWRPTVANTITASALPTLSSATNATDSTLTGWTKSIAANTWIIFHVNSCSSIHQLIGALTVSRP